MSHNSNNGVAYTNPDLTPSRFKQPETNEVFILTQKDMSTEALLSRAQKHAAQITLQKTAELPPELQAIYELAINS